MNKTPTNQSPLLARLWQYQRERFPVFKHGVLIVSFSFCALCLSSLLRGVVALPSLAASLVAFICLFLFFLQLRLADEHKDFAKDAKYRPERAVPRGLVSFKELDSLAFLSVLIQLALCWWLSPKLLFLLFLVWFYLLAMTAEFGVSTWLEKRPLIYMLSHMVIMSLIDWFATACDWLVQGESMPMYLGWFLAISFSNGIVIEIGRKTWAPELEREGVESYSRDWGRGRALAVWLSAVLFSFVCSLIIALRIHFFVPIAVILGALTGLAIWLARVFYHRPSVALTKHLENFSGLWVASLYFSLGIIPLGYQLWIQ